MRAFPAPLFCLPERVNRLRADVPAPLHPLDQYRAFQTLRDKGMSIEEIAAAFFVAPRVVQQRLRLAAVSPSRGSFCASNPAGSASAIRARTVRDGWRSS